MGTKVAKLSYSIETQKPDSTWTEVNSGAFDIQTGGEYWIGRDSGNIVPVSDKVQPKRRAPRWSRKQGRLYVSQDADNRKNAIALVPDLEANDGTGTRYKLLVDEKPIGWDYAEGGQMVSNSELKSGQEITKILTVGKDRNPSIQENLNLSAGGPKPAEYRIVLKIKGY